MKSQRKEDTCPSICGDWGESMVDFTDKHRCCVGCLLKILVITFFVFIVVTLSLKIGFVDSLWNTLSCFANQVTNTRDSSIAWASWLTAFATIGAFIFAWLAYRQSLRARKNASFCTLFAQLLGSHKHIFGNKALAETVFIATGTYKISYSYFGINPNDDVFTSFFNYYKTQHHTLIPSPDKGASSTITDVWDKYVSNLKEEAKFSNCFKYVYYEIKTVLDEDSLTLEERKHYIGIIQANMNYDELFCYFINLLQHFARIPEYGSDYMKGLYANDFFENIMNRPDFKYRVYIDELKKSAVGDIVCKIVGK